MWLNRLLIIVFLIMSSIFASFYGGNISYAFFYLSIVLPILSLLYTFYVYIRFRLYQEIGKHIVVKGELTPYSFTIANEDIITFNRIKVNFLWDKSTILNADSVKEYTLLPNGKKTMETYLRCNYRGEYFVGVNSVDIMDFFYLFRITYPIQSKLKVTVLPRIIYLNNLSLIPSLSDLKRSSSYMSKDMDRIDIETRPYQKGDSKKLIHWKASAKRNELFTRKLVSDPKTEIAIIMDLSTSHKDELERIIYEDYAIECTLSIAQYCKEHHTLVNVFYESASLDKFAIKNHSDFMVFYHMCANLSFRSRIPFEQVIEEIGTQYIHNGYIILITYSIKSSYLSILNLQKKGGKIAVLYISDHEKEEEAYLKGLRLSQIAVRIITRDADIMEVLSL